jgi:2-amino-4-hydroxy-6-hydroxymethyldihydropteridine diphosphokinase
MEQIDSGSGRALQPQAGRPLRQPSPTQEDAQEDGSVAVALGANLGDPLATLLAVRHLLAAELGNWWQAWVQPGQGAAPQAGAGGVRLRWSPLFRTAPVGGPLGQPDYLNAAVVIDGGPPPSAADRPGLDGSPPGAMGGAPPNAIARAGAGFEPDAVAALALLQRLQWLEQRFGRVRAERWGPRSLDLDLLWCGPQQLHSPVLQLPHPRLRERAFVLTPLAAIDPDLTVPAAGEQPAAAVSRMLEALEPGALEPAEEAQQLNPARRPTTARLAPEPPPQRLAGQQGWPE